MANIIRCYHPGGTHEDIDKVLDIPVLQEKLKGYVEAHNAGVLYILCDEEGRLKGLPCTGAYGSMVFCGDVYVGAMKSKGLTPVPPKAIEAFEQKWVRFSAP